MLLDVASGRYLHANVLQVTAFLFPVDGFELILIHLDAEVPYGDDGTVMGHDPTKALFGGCLFMQVEMSNQAHGNRLR